MVADHHHRLDRDRQARRESLAALRLAVVGDLRILELKRGADSMSYQVTRDVEAGDLDDLLYRRADVADVIARTSRASTPASSARRVTSSKQEPSSSSTVPIADCRSGVSVVAL